MRRTFGLNIKKIRESQNITQQELANISGVSISVVTKLESQHTKACKLESAESLANALGVDLDVIYNDDFRKTKILSFFSIHGGVGKTSSIINLANEFSYLKSKVLIVDLSLNADATYLASKTSSTVDVLELDSNNIMDIYKKSKSHNCYINTISMKELAIENGLNKGVCSLSSTYAKVFINKIADYGLFDIILVDTSGLLREIEDTILELSTNIIMPVIPGTVQFDRLISDEISNIDKDSYLKKVMILLNAVSEAHKEVCEHLMVKNTKELNIFNTFIDHKYNMKEFTNIKDVVEEARIDSLSKKYRKLAREIKLMQ